MITFILVTASIAAAGIAAYYYMEKSGKKLQEIDKSLTDDDLKKNSPKLKTWLESSKTELATKKSELTTLEEELKTLTDEGEKAAKSQEIANKQNEIAQLVETQKLVQNVQSWGSWYPVMSASNIAWTVGIFAVVATIGVVISKWVASLFKSDKE